MKRFIVLLILLLLLCSCSNNRKPVAYGAVLQKEDQAVMCFIDEDNKVLYEMEMDRFTQYVYFGEDAVLYSYDGHEYQSITLSNFKKGETVIMDDEIYYYVTNGYCYSLKGHDITCKKGDDVETLKNVYYLFGLDGKAYVLYLDGTISVRDALTNQQEALLEAPFGEFYGLVKIGGVVYYVNDSGYTPIKDNEFGFTYVFPLTSYEIAGVFKNHLTVYEGEEIAAYFVSFDAHRMILTPDYEDESYEGVDFSKRFPQYYAKGYEVTIARAY